MCSKEHMNTLLPSTPPVRNLNAGGRPVRRAAQQLQYIMERVAADRDALSAKQLRFGRGAEAQKKALAQNLRSLRRDIADLEAAIQDVRPFIQKKESPLKICDLRLPI